MTSPPHVVVVRQAMATRFEIVLEGANPAALRAAGEEALDEVERLEGQLSLYRPDTEIARVNALAHGEAVRVSPPVFHLLEEARAFHQATGGAFDITIGPLMRCWGLAGGAGRIPSAAELADARARVGMHLVHLDPAGFTVRFERAGMMLDLGAIGKGHAVERAAELLRELGIANALIHGGTSTICGLGCPTDQDAWRVSLQVPEQFLGTTPARSAWEDEHARERRRPNRLAGTLVPPPDDDSPAKGALPAPRPGEAPPTLLAIVPLRNESLSVSAVWGKAFVSGGRTYGHVIDPRTGAPADRAIMAAVALPSATATDALSTALLTLGLGGPAQLAAGSPSLKSFVLQQEPGRGLVAECHGIAPAATAPIRRMG